MEPTFAQAAAAHDERFDRLFNPAHDSTIDRCELCRAILGDGEDNDISKTARPVYVCNECFANQRP